MSAASRRPIGELPGDPARLHLTYTHGHPLRPWDDEDTLECWHARISYGLDGDDDEQDEDPEETATDGLPATPEPGSPVGRVILYRLRADTGRNRWRVADDHSGDLEVIASAVLARNGRGYTTAFEDAVTLPAGDLLVLDRVRLAKEWRGFGLGPICAAEAIRRLSAGCCAVATYPAMAEYPADRQEVTEAYRSTAKKKIEALWESIGFHPFKNGVWLLDPALREPGDRLVACRADLENLSARWSRQR
ncbi:hypothetical protein SAMN05216371_0131 [Streptomyces sp. TLI_053]|uniref:hypothetical protein n=1 Tax=Streptomyces sp. TLI_053 TaxID=1855352 RepID=UPI00087A64CC|nr:hypothetical protein [Streptomyces sp. TLI_053]SDS54408.1 hypothetical protein SAMN05216371_0131 [Streptomyces sp. TLI_053]